jgi:F-type H+-transporting ATPase subunit c
MVTEILDPAVAQALHPVLAAVGGEFSGKAAEVGKEGGKAIALGVGAGGGAAGAGAGIGMLFGKVIEAVTRQPEMRDEITSIQWLGFALTEATFFYGLVGGFIAFFL